MKDNLIGAQDMHATAEVMKTPLIDTSIYQHIRDQAIHGRHTYVTYNVVSERISELRALGYTVTEGQGDIKWVVIEW